MRLCNDQVHVQAEVDQAEATTRQYANMKSKKKVRKLFYDTNMSAPIVVDFKNQMNIGSFYICIICNCWLYKILVIYSKKKIMIMYMWYWRLWLNHMMIFCLYVELAIKHWKNKFIPCQAVSNKLDITFLPKEFESIYKLEKVLVSRRILFKK